MRKFVILLLLAILAVDFCNAHRPKHFKAIYTDIDSLVVENVQIPYSEEKQDYIIELPRSSKILIAYNDDRSKAIVLRSGYQYMRHLEYKVKDDETRTVLYYKDKHIYCGFIYDKRVKAGSYFEAIEESEKDRLVNRLPFLKRLPTFNN